MAERGRLVVFSQGRWSSLVRSGDTMYGVANDPTTGADVVVDGLAVISLALVGIGSAVAAHAMLKGEPRHMVAR